MEQATEVLNRKPIGHWIGIGVVAAAIIALLAVILETDLHPRTDDASVRANFIENCS